MPEAAHKHKQKADLKRKKKGLVKQTEKDRAQHYDIDGVSYDTDHNEVVVATEPEKGEHSQ